MPKRDRNDGPALVVLWIILGWIALVSILGLWARYEVEHHIGCPAYAETAKQDEKEVAASCFDDHMFFGDGYAQWAMTVLAVFATGASIWALVYLRRTLAETSRIGQAQTRAYLGIQSIRVIRNDDKFPGERGFVLNVQIANTGQSPARDVTLSFSLDNRLHASKPRVGVNHFNKRSFFVGAQQSHSEEISVSLSVGPYNRLVVETGRNTDPPDQNTSIFVEGTLAYTDCFDVRRSFEWSYYFPSEFAGGGVLGSGYMKEGYIHLGKDTSFLSYKYATQEQVVGRQ